MSRARSAAMLLTLMAGRQRKLERRRRFAHRECRRMAQTAAAEHRHDGSAQTGRQNLIIGALGVVYGDIGTSPLYTVKQCFVALGGITPTSIYGVLSLITWVLFSVVTLKYVSVV